MSKDLKNSNKVQDDPVTTAKDKPLPKKESKGCCGVKKGKPAAKKDPKTVKAQNKVLMKIVGEQWCLLLIASPFMFIGAVGDFLFPDLIGRIINAMRSEDDDMVRNTLLFWIGVILVGAIGTAINNILFGMVAEKIGDSIRKKLFAKLIHLDTAFYDEARTGDLLSRLTSDTQVVQEGLSTSVAMFARAAAICICMVAIMFTYSWVLTVYALLLITPNLSIGRIFYTLFMSSNEQFQTAKADLGSVAQEAFGNIRTLKAFANEVQTLERYDIENAKVYDKGMYKAYVYGGFYFCFTVFQSSAFACILYIVALQYDELNLTIGTCMAYLLYMRKIVDTFGEMMNASQQIARVKGASFKIAELLIREIAVKHPEPKDALKKENPEGAIKLENVKFHYPSKKDVQVLNGVSIEIPQNQVVAFVGASGCGKSSVMKLIQRFYDPQEGKLLYSDIDLKQVDNQWFHQDQLAIVQQEPALFSGSIRENILYGTNFKDKSEEEVQAAFELACQQASVHQFLQDKQLFPDGDKTLVGERGVKLSGGQKQRIAIARALIRKPRVLLLDEATSALDSESEHQVQLALDKLMDGAQKMTVVVIAHRLSTIRNANNIIVLSKGKILEQGNHDQLIGRKGAYFKLVERQLMTASLGEDIKKN